MNSGTIEATNGGTAIVAGTWTDDGVISADSTSMVYLGGTFSVDSGSSFAGTGAVDIRGTLDNTGATLTLDDPELSFGVFGGTIDGGTVETTGGAALFATDSGGTLDGVTLDGTLDMTGYYPYLDVTGGLTLDHGTIDIGTPVDSGIYGQLIFQGAQTLGGSGSIVFGGNGNNAIDTESSGGDSGTLTIGPNVTVGGDDGFIGYNNNNSEIETPIVIQGTVDSDTSGGGIFIYSAGGLNSGTIEATNGGTAIVAGTWTDDGVISADSTSTVYLGGTFSVDSGSSFAGTGAVDIRGTLDNTGATLTLDDPELSFGVFGGTIDGGTVETTGGAALFATQSGGTLDGVTLKGTLDLTGYYPLLDVTGGLTLDHGTIDIGTLVDSNTNGTLIFQGAQTLGGSGSIVFGGNGGNGIDTESSGGDSGTLTIGPNVTVGGDYGSIGLNNYNSGIETPIVIQGTVDADTSGGVISFYSASGSNSGTIEATDGGTVWVYGTWTDDGVISADSTSTVYLGGTFSVGSGSSFAGTGTVEITGTLDNSGATLTLNDPELSFGVAGGTIDGGTVETTGGAALFATQSGGTLDGVTFDGTLDLTGYYPLLDVTGGLTLDHGTIDIGTLVDSNTNGTLIFQGAQTLGGSGSIVFGGNGGNGIDTESSGGDSGTLTIGPNVTVGGDYGSIGLNDYNSGIETPIVIQGTVDADTSGGVISFYSASGSNSGTIEATDGGTVWVYGTWTDDGVISADSTSTVYLGGTFSVDSGSSFAGTGAVDIAGTLDNSGETLTLNDPDLSFGVAGGTIDGGTVETTGGAALFATQSGGTLDGVTFDGTLDLTGYYALLDVTGGLTLDNGTIDIGTLVDSGTMARSYSRAHRPWAAPARSSSAATAATGSTPNPVAATPAPSRLARRHRRRGLRLHRVQQR